MHVPAEKQNNKQDVIIMKTKAENCLCGSDAHYVLSCSGACDVGHLTDLVARKLAKEGVRKMNCLAVVGAGVSNSIETFKKSNVLILDGCAVDCGKKIADQAGMENYSYLRMTDLGLEKGKTEVSDATIKKVFDTACVIN